MGHEWLVFGGNEPVMGSSACLDFKVYAESRNNITGGQETRQAGKEDPRHSGEFGSSSAHLFLEDGGPFYSERERDVEMV